MEEQEDYFSVTISKRSAANSDLSFECCANRGFLEIDQITLKGKDGAVHMVKLHELEEEGQEAFYDYLEDRGVDNEFARTVFLALDYYDQMEFRQWVRGIRDFVSA